MKILLSIFLFSLSLSAKVITPSDVYAQVDLIKEDLHYLLDYYNVSHDNDEILKDTTMIKGSLKPRNAWQKSYEILVKINMLRGAHGLPRIEPVGMDPVVDLNPDMVYEQTQRIITELNIFKKRMNIPRKKYEYKLFKNKTPIDVFNRLSYISVSFDKLIGGEFTPSYVFSETMRVYDDITTILQHLNIKDETIPSKRDEEATPFDTYSVGIKILDKIGKIQSRIGISRVDFSGFKKDNLTPSDVFTINQMILAELQTIKAYIGLNNYITPAAIIYSDKSPSDVDQLMNWNLRKISLIWSSGVKLK